VPQLQPPQQQQSVAAPKQHRVFTGVITKLHDNFGFIDEDVFFQLRCVVILWYYFTFITLLRVTTAMSQRCADPQILIWHSSMARPQRPMLHLVDLTPEYSKGKP